MIEPSVAGGDADCCVCDYKQPIVRCEGCGMPNPAGTSFCRRCRGRMGARASRSAAVQPSGADFLTIRGSFRRPPLTARGFVYALSASGTLCQLSPRSSARAIELGSVGDRSAGFNMNALVDVSAIDTEGPRGWTFLAASRSAIAAMSVATSKVTALYEPPGGEAISSNRSEADSTGFRGLAANGEFCAFVVAASEGEFVLTLKFFSKDRAIAQPVAVRGSRAAGPALHNGTVMLCSDEEAAIYDTMGRKALKMPLPHGFEPLLRPSAPELSVAPGSIPMAGWKERDERLVGQLAGVQQGVTGLLQIDFSRAKMEFRSVPDGSSIFTNADGSLGLGLLDRVERIGVNGAIIRAGRLQPAMPASVSDGIRCWFMEEGHRDRHRLSVSVYSRAAELTFEDARCTGNTCFGTYSIDGQMLVAYADQTAKDEDAGMRFAHWSIG